LASLSFKREEILGWPVKFIGVSSSEPLKERIWLKGCMELFHINTLEVLGIENLTEKPSDFSLVIFRNFFSGGV
jgi:hypothetical protein